MMRLMGFANLTFVREDEKNSDCLQTWKEILLKVVREFCRLLISSYATNVKFKSFKNSQLSSATG